ncbi:MAG: hypothetical protein A2W99_09480 [Bacteroidetes bacterium GWF2_33_16]|nr:MAG: hypothetical protein A2X00_06390 [Bacteroidetes bacterium GWE2_32_14]OFY07228.1 MAG: hypothetical protein A2W99_09480 [Bacteroidetes bacterium GWF2_33_16]
MKFFILIINLSDGLYLIFIIKKDKLLFYLKMLEYEKNTLYHKIYIAEYHAFMLDGSDSTSY